MKKWGILLIVLVSLPIFATENETVKWPIPDWEENPDSTEMLSTPQCKAFENFSVKSKNFLTEGLVVIKDGQINYEYYDDKYSADQPHIVWSVSKTITGALLGTAVKEGKISLDQNLNQFYPQPSLSDNYQKIKIKNLFYLDTGFIWNEFYSKDVQHSPVINMLYGTGHLDMAKFAASKEIVPEGPSYIWNYSTGTPAITMKVLQNVYGKDYDEMPWKNFANPLGLKKFIFEQDKAGTFNGGSSVFTTPRDMAKIGYLYLNNGHWDKDVILTEDWIKKTLTVSPGYLSDGTVIHDITDDGVYGGSIWLNKAVKKGFGRPYPVSPEDMYLAMGHYGQLIIVLPTQKMVIARTGHDSEYNSNIDEFVTRAISCFADSHYPIGKKIPPPTQSGSNLKDILDTLKSGIESNIIQPSIAKTICSCHFVSGLDINTCYSRSNIPLASTLTTTSITESDGQTGVYSVKTIPNFLGRTLGLKSENLPVAYYDTFKPEYGCTLE